MDTNLWKRTCEIDYFRTISCGITPNRCTGYEKVRNIPAPSLVLGDLGVWSGVRGAGSKPLDAGSAGAIKFACAAKQGQGIT